MDAAGSPTVLARPVPMLVVAALLGTFLGWAGARPLSVLAVGNVVLWGVATVALGMIDGTAPAKAVRLGVYGFALGFAFMCFGYTGEAALSTRLVPFALIGLFCAVCAIALGALVHVIRSRTGTTA
jgi:hypothetical protein